MIRIADTEPTSIFAFTGRPLDKEAARNRGQSPVFGWYVTVHKPGTVPNCPMANEGADPQSPSRPPSPHGSPILLPPAILPPTISLPFAAIKYISKKVGNYAWGKVEITSLLHTILQESPSGIPASSGSFQDRAWKYFGTWATMKDDIPKWEKSLNGTCVGGGWHISSVVKSQPWVEWWVRNPGGDTTRIE